METIKEVLNNINDFLLALKINYVYVLLWVSAGYIQGVYMAGVTKLTSVYKTLILGSVFSLVYAILLRDAGNKNTWVEFCASYLFATSLYELALKNLVNMIITKAQSIFKSKLDSTI